jgi:hypothetical protein
VPNKTVSEDALEPLEENPPYPTATPEEIPPHGAKIEDIWGRWPGDIDDGFEEELHRIRGHYRRWRPPSC